MAEKSITVILSYYNQPKSTLIRHIEYWKTFEEKRRFTFFIIDDASKQPVHELLKDIEYDDLDLHIYQVNQDLYCNIAGVRNLGAKECKTPYMVILDMDTVINDTMSLQLLELVQKNSNNKFAFKFNRHVPENTSYTKHNQPHPAICLIRKEDYWHIGGCEEDLVGHYGQTDPIFWYRARGVVDVYICKNINLLYFPDAEADINRDTTVNTKLFELKKVTQDWSTDFIRFDWKKVI
jgi:hypothetical protein